MILTSIESQSRLVATFADIYLLSKSIGILSTIFLNDNGGTMAELTTDFQSLPEEYQQIIRLAQDKYKIAIAPLQLLVGGWSGAVVYLVSVASNDT